MLVYDQMYYMLKFKADLIINLLTTYICVASLKHVIFINYLTMLV